MITSHDSNPITWEAFQQICAQQQILLLTDQMSWRATFFVRRGTPVFIISSDAALDSALATALIKAYLKGEPRLIETSETLDETTISHLEERLKLARAKTPTTP
jgi:hypothetical protein